MKRLVAIIIILVIILGGLMLYRNTRTKNESVSVEEVEKIETYLAKIYMWKEVTQEALPCFEDINQADETWIWEVVKKNLEDYEISYEQIQNKAKELFGENFTKEFPKQGTEYLLYNTESNLYYAVGMGLDEEEDVFLLNSIKKTKTGYEVEIVEYLEDYSLMLNEGGNQIIIKNLKRRRNRKS